MNNQIDYMIEELKILSGKGVILRQRIDGMVAFYLTGLAALVTATLGLLTLQQVINNLKSFGMGLAYLGISVISAYVFLRVLHLRFRSIEIDLHMHTFRTMILKEGITAAAYLSSELPENDLFITKRSGSMIFGLGFISSVGLGLSVRSFFGEALMSLEWIVSIISMVISLTVFTLSQTKEARKTEKMLLMDKTKKANKKTRNLKAAG